MISAKHVPPSLGLYVHFPWCVKKCPYCDFNSHPLTGELQEDAYVQALTREFQAWALESSENDPLRFDSVFFGGGTPSLFSARALGSFMATIKRHLKPGAEITMEANPGAAERDDMRAYREAGINRLSIGAQSFSPTLLKRLGRIHGPDETHACVAAARRGGFDNINLDVMYGLPGQTPEGALADLRAAIALSPEHLSWYQLTVEPKTEFARRPPPGLPGEQALFEMETAGRALLKRAGLQRYEISAYALPGAACRHNLVYWTFGDYLGLGAGAHGKLSAAGESALRLTAKGAPPPSPKTGLRPARQTTPLNRNALSAGLPTARLRTNPATPLNYSPSTTFRTRNPRQPRLYLQNSCQTEWIQVSAAELPGEFMMNALRLVGGVERPLFEARTGLPWRVVAPAWRKTTELGLTERGRIAATPLGLRHLDTLVQHFI